jgi:MoaA/NifB/PqqE/SkfB family radical SAM enzyme
LREEDELDTIAVKKMVDQMKQAGVLMISLTGGEPLIREDIGEIIRYIKNRSLVCKLNTNGVLVKKRLDDLKRLDVLQISIDGPPDIHDPLRGNGASFHAGQAVQWAQSAGIKLQVITCLTKNNVTYLDRVLDYGLELGVGFCFQVLSDKEMTAEEKASCVPDKNELVDSLDYLIQLIRTKDKKSRAIGSKLVELKYYRDMITNHRSGCDCSLVTATMLPDGHLIFCGNGKNYEQWDARKLGFSEAFSRLRIPDCDGCVCVGKLRLSKAYQLDLAIIRETLKL